MAYARGDDRYPDVSLPSVLPLPNPPMTPEQTVLYVKQLHNILAMNQTRLAEAIRVLSYHRGTIGLDTDSTQFTLAPDGGRVGMPDPVGSNVMQTFVDRTTGQARFFVDVLDLNGAPLWYEVGGGAAGAVTGEPTGFQNTNQDSTISFVAGTRTFTIQPSGTDYTTWLQGVSLLHDAAEDVIIPDTEGMHHIYFDANGDLVSDLSPTLEDLVKDNVYVANLYWDATNKALIGVGDERHGLMPWQVHFWLHTFHGTQHYSGLGLGDIVADGSGNLDVHVQMSTSSGSILDEDLMLTIAANAHPAYIPVIYKDGAAGDWRVSTDAAPIKTAGTGRGAINHWSGAAWTQVEVTNNKYFLTHIFAANGISNQMIAIQGEYEYNSVTDARAGANTEIGILVTGVLPMQEFVPVGTVIFQTSSSYTNGWKSRIRSTVIGDDYVSWLGTTLSPGQAPSNHENLTGRDTDSQHPATAVDADVTSFGGILSASETDVQLALDAIDDHAHDALYLKLDTSNDPLTGFLQFANTYGIDFKNTGGGKVSGYYFDSANKAWFGNGSYDCEVDWDSMLFGDVSGGDYTDIEKVDGNILQYGDAKIHTEATVEADDAVYSKLFEATKIKAMANNTSQNFFKWAGAAGNGLGYTVHFKLMVEFQVLGTTYYWVRAGKIEGNLLDNGTYVWGNSASGVVWKGAAQVRSSAGGTIATTMNETVGQGAGGAVTSLGPYFLVNLTGGTTYVSGECQFLVIADDADHNVYTIF